MNTCHRPILLVEDNADDIFFMKRAFRTAGITATLEVVTDGDEAIQHLSDPDSTQPCLVILDLKLPKRGGLDVLRWIRHESNVRSMVVLVLTTSKETSDLERAYELRANAYLVKPSGVGQLAEMAKAIQSFWLTHNHFPGE